MRTAVNHAVNIEDVRVTIREAERPNIAELATGLAIEGLQKPIVLNPKGELIDGLRRLRAAQLLGWTTIPAVRVSTLDSALIRIKAAQLAEDAAPLSISAAAEVDEMLQTLVVRRQGTSAKRDVIAPALGFYGSKLWQARQLWKAATGRAIGQPPEVPHPAVIEKARAVLAAVDAGAQLDPEWRGWRKFLKTREKPKRVRLDVADDELLREGIPDPRLRTQHATERRKAWIRKLAADGMTSAQIGETIGMRPPLVREWAKKLGVDLKADRVVGRGQIGRTVDVDRVMATLVADLDAMAWAISTVEENLGALDPQRLQGWIRDIGSFNYRTRMLAEQMKDHLNDHLTEGAENGD
jgi:hypothetical protein